MALFRDYPGWASTRKVKPIWILLKQETVSGSGISWDICKSATHSRQITMPAPHHSVFYLPNTLPATQPTASKHWRHIHRMDGGMRKLKRTAATALAWCETCYSTINNTGIPRSGPAADLIGRVTLEELDFLVEFDVVGTQFVRLVLLQLHLLLQHHHLLQTHRHTHRQTRGLA